MNVAVGVPTLPWGIKAGGFSSISEEMSIFCTASSSAETSTPPTLVSNNSSETTVFSTSHCSQLFTEDVSSFKVILPILTFCGRVRPAANDQWFPW